MTIGRAEVGAHIAASVIVPVKDNQVGINNLIRGLEAQTAQNQEPDRKRGE
jgi:hypothetical protein